MKAHTHTHTHTLAIQMTNLLLKSVCVCVCVHKQKIIIYNMFSAIFTVYKSVRLNFLIDVDSVHLLTYL